MHKLLMAISVAWIFTGTAFAGENCTCRYKGNDIAEGASICIKTASGSQMARCDRVLNNTSWKMLGQECPTAQLAPYKNQSAADVDHARKLVARIILRQPS